MGDISKDVNSKFKDQHTKALINILYTAGWITAKQNTFFGTFGLSPQQYNILRILKGAKGPLRAQVVKERMIERSPNATRLMDKLCAKGLVERFDCKEDRRVVHVVITNKGLELLDEISDDFNDEWLKNISEEEATQLSDLLDKLR
ncbi:MarR family transcriptional regulator [Mangrovimonas sp. AS39]|uniref:MarR family winged helix-turn-helix transcriptional regulator n=1 Tax=Mangrovimonas TaxID=1211036 RepID=UPI0006B51FE5|nr:MULTISPECIES: MarR family transcriptional regulator [Mangrovimonas]MCF1191589.1 MarR family transcriptional regulator [Mangrovimonas futianensis]MCF1195523.1 MarR family transcriptional regulator [Mangrovimonas futianensis]NIK91983.1 MarR family transcriptional regulator [Mangrovimonas sp. CR14]